jgi:cardiolipin synthase A/B
MEKHMVKRVAPIVASLLAVHGCASLPDAALDRAVTPHEEVALENASGPVSDARSDAILDRLEVKTGASELLTKHMSYEQAINADSPLVLGNKLALLQNGPATYEAMFAAMRTAKDHINLETFIFGDDDTGQRFADLLLERQAAGVQVNVIYDSVGSIKTPTVFFDRLSAGGIRVLEFNPVNPLKSGKKKWRLNNRDHRKVLVVDGRIAFAGGINISSTYSSAPTAERHSAKPAGDTSLKTGWRDTHIEIEGPVVAEFQKLFLATWVAQKGEPLPAANYFPELKAQGDEIVRAIGSTPDDAQSLIFLTLMSAISHAELSVHLTVAYFAPDAQLLKVLIDAAQRGVDVELVVPGVSDSAGVFYLGRSFYAELLQGGVKIYQRRGGVMHAKTACIDGVWSTIGSTNLDWRSFLHNNEVNAVILGQGFAAQMESMFTDDRAESDPIALEDWQQRPLPERAKERLARIGAHLF